MEVLNPDPGACAPVVCLMPFQYSPVMAPAQRSGNPAFLGPLVPFSFVLAYQADFTYGDKVGRITRNAEEILAKERNLLALPGGALTLQGLDAALAARAGSGAAP